MAGDFGIKETQEGVNGILLLAALIATQLKDGFQAGQDIEAIWAALKNDVELNKALKDAYEGSGQIPSELKDLDVMEGVQLVMGSAPGVMKIAAALRK